MRFIIITTFLLFVKTVFPHNLPDTSTGGFKEYCRTTLHNKIDSITAEYKRNGKLNSYSCFLNYNQPEAVNFMARGVNGYQPSLVETDPRVTTFRQHLTQFNNTSLSVYKVVYINIEAWDVIFKNEVINDTAIDYTNYHNFLKGDNSDFQDKNASRVSTVLNTVGSAFGNTPPELLFIIDAKFYYWHTRKPDNATIGAQNQNYVSKAGYIGFYPYHYDISGLPQSVKDDQKKIYTIFLDMLNEQWKANHEGINSDYDWLDPVYTCIYTALTRYKALDVILTLQNPEELISHFAANIGPNSSLYKALSLEQRIHVLKVLAKEHLFDNAVNLMLNCITNCPEQTRRQMLDSIAFAKLYDGEANLQRAIFLNINGDNLAKYLVATAQIANKVFPNYTSEEDAMLDTAFIKLKPGGFLGSAIYNRIDNATGNIMLANLSQAQLVYKHPFKKVLVTITENYSYGNFTWQRGEYKNVPAILAYALFNHESNQRLWQYLNTAVDVGMLFIGGGEIKYLFKISNWVKAFKDARLAKSLIQEIITAKACFDLAVNDVAADILRQSEQGQRFIAKYNQWTMWVDAGYLGTSVLRSQLKNLYRSIKQESRDVIEVVTHNGGNEYRIHTYGEGGTTGFKTITANEAEQTQNFLNEAEQKIQQQSGFVDDTYLVGSAFTDAYQQVRDKLAGLLGGNNNLLNPTELNQLYRDLENQAHKELVAYLKDLPTAEFENAINTWKEFNKSPATNHLKTDVDALKSYVRAPGALVPNSLIGKITQQGANKLKAWTKGKTINYKSAAGTNVLGAEAEAKIFEDIENAIGNKNVLESLEDAQGRFSIVLERPGQTNQLVTLHPTISGEYKITTFDLAYNPNLNLNIPVPVSRNRLVPDYAGTSYLHPDNKRYILNNQGNGVRIEMKGTRGKDFTEAFRVSGISKANANDYTWHHMDDFEIIDGKPYCTMQLVERSAHGGSNVTGMAHSGSVAQWKAYYGNNIYP